LVRDEIPDPARGPQSADKTKRLGPPLERTLELAQLGRVEFGRAPGVLGLTQTSHSRLLKLARPAADRLPMHAHRPRHLGLAESLFKQSRRFHPPLFQSSEVPPHPRWITHA
jgi:hypothetical protein